MPKAIKKRVDKKADKQGDLGETVSDIREKLKGQQKTLVYSFLILGLLVIVVIGLLIYSHVNADKAADLEYDGYKLLSSGATPEQAASAPDIFKKALEKFNASYAAKKSPTVLLYIANCYYALGNFDETIKTLKKLVDQYPDPKISSLAYYKMAMAYIKKGDLNSAVNTFDTLTSIKGALLQDMALFECGKTLESMGRTDEAKNKYRELITKFPKSDLVNDAKAKLG